MPLDAPIRWSGGSFGAPLTVYDQTESGIFVLGGSGTARLGKTGGTVGFYGTTPIALQTGVAVTAGGIHAALVALGLITA